MEKVRVINNHKTVSRGITKSIVNVIPIEYHITFFIVLVLATINMFSYTNLYINAKHNNTMNNELKVLMSENSNLEEKKANLLNIRELQSKAEQMGFIYNNSINYLNKE